MYLMSGLSGFYSMGIAILDFGLRVLDFLGIAAFSVIVHPKKIPDGITGWT